MIQAEDNSNIADPDWKHANISLEANEKKSHTIEFTMNENKDGFLVFSMGQIDETAYVAHQITISNIEFIEVAE